jgi:5-methylcytosine-specific restriction endonuclease McrA
LVNIAEFEELEKTREWQLQERHRAMMESATTKAVIECVKCSPDNVDYFVHGDDLLRDGVDGSPTSWAAHLREKCWYDDSRHRHVLERAFHIVASATVALDSVAGDARKAASTKAASRNVPARMRWIILSRDGHRCVSCGATAKESALHIDHIIPWSKGGLTVMENLQTLCARCNIGKSNLVPDCIHAQR